MVTSQGLPPIVPARFALPHNFALLSDDNPRFPKVSREPITAQLNTLGVRYWPVQGVYDDKAERSYLVDLGDDNGGLLSDTLTAIARLQGQESILFSRTPAGGGPARNALVYCRAEHKPLLGLGVETMPREPDAACYTILPDGSYLICNL